MSPLPPAEREALFRAAPHTARESELANLRVDFSAKLQRRVYFYGHACYELCVALECDPLVVRYNERPGKVSYVNRAGDEVQFKLQVVSELADGTVRVHKLIDAEVAEPPQGALRPAQRPPPDPLADWAGPRGILVIRTVAASLRENEVLLRNRVKLWRWCSVPSRRAGSALTTQLLIAFSDAKRLSIGQAISACRASAVFEDRSDDELAQAIHQMVMSGQLASDINVKPLSTRTAVWIV